MISVENGGGEDVAGLTSSGCKRIVGSIVDGPVLSTTDVTKPGTLFSLAMIDTCTVVLLCMVGFFFATSVKGLGVITVGGLALPTVDGFGVSTLRTTDVEGFAVSTANGFGFPVATRVDTTV